MSHVGRRDENAGLNVLLQSFLYVCLDEHTRKSTHTLSVAELSDWVLPLISSNQRTTVGERDKRPLEKMCDTALSFLNTQQE